MPFALSFKSKRWRMHFIVDKYEKLLGIIFLAVFYLFISTNLFAAKIKDLSNIIGVRDNQLIGYGLVVGLKGSGDSSSKFTNQTLSNLLKNVNVKLDPIFTNKILIILLINFN